MKKVVKAQLWVPKETEELIKINCDHLNKLIEGWSIYYDCFLAEYNDEEVTCFEVCCEAKTFKDADSYYRMMKEAIKESFGKRPKEIIKIKLERIWLYEQNNVYRRWCRWVS